MDVVPVLIGAVVGIVAADLTAPWLAPRLSDWYDRKQAKR